MIHGAAIGRPSEAVTDQQTVEFALHSSVGSHAVQNADRLAIAATIVDAAHPKSAVQTDLAVVETRHRIAVNLGQSRALAVGGIEDHNIPADGHYPVAAAGNPETPHGRVKAPETSLSGGNVDPVNCASGDVRPQKPIV